MQDGRKTIWSIPYIFFTFFPSLKQNFIAYRSSSRPDWIFEIHQLWQSGFSRMYSNCCCRCSFKLEILKIGQSSHKMYSNNTVIFQESTTILNAHTKKVWKFMVSTSYLVNSYYLIIKRISNSYFLLLLRTNENSVKQPSLRSCLFSLAFKYQLLSQKSAIMIQPHPKIYLCETTFSAQYADQIQIYAYFQRKLCVLLSKLSTRIEYLFRARQTHPSNCH